MTSQAAKEAIFETRALIGDCRRETLFALMSDVREGAILKGILEKLGDLEEKIDDISDALKSEALPCVRRGM